MNETNSKLNLLGQTQQQLKRFFSELGEREFRAVQVMKWIHHHGVSEFHCMTDLSKTLRERLTQIAEIRAPRIVTEQHSTDGTCKWMLEVDEGNAVETVFIPESDRGTLCVSSQVGCALDCTFCSTARQGFNRNLSSAEIVGQLWLTRPLLQAEVGNSRVISNVVMMGMGEPLLNLNNVLDAMDVMKDDLAYGLGKRRVTLSTSGVVPAIDRLKDAIDVSLAVSLHAPNDELRSRLVPLNRKYPIRDLLAACKRFVENKNCKHSVTFEYVMLDGVNDSAELAMELGELIKDMRAKVNLIPFNPFPGTSYRRSSNAAIDRFRTILQGCGITTITRKTRGADIDAACGQLVGRVDDRSHRQQHFARLEQRLSR